MHFGEALQQAVAVLAAAVAVVFVSARLRLPSVFGLILTGLLIGPSGLGWVGDTERVEVFAEIGVVLLLFIIGLELNLGELGQLRRPFLLGGGAQTLLTMAAATGLALTWWSSWRSAFFAAMVVTLSSTAVVLKLYADRRETRTPQGRVALGVLLFQDFLVIPMIVVVPVLAGTESMSTASLLLRFGGALGVVAGVVAVAWFVMPQLLHQIALVRVRELFVLAALLTCLALAWFTWSLGFSLALGAFVAGLLVSETAYSHQIVADIIPFRDVFASLFFVSIGMLVDLDFALSRLPALLGLTAAVVVLKAATAGIATRLVGYPLRVAFVAGLGLAQIGEFSFVLMEVGREAGLIGEAGFQTLLVVAVLTLLATPLLVRVAPGLGQRLASRLGRGPEGVTAAGDRELSAHVIVVGYGMNGNLLCRVLGEAHIPYLVVELNAGTVREAQRRGVPILFGDATRPGILEYAGIERAQVVVFAISDLPAVMRSVPMARELNPSVGIIVRTGAVEEIEALREAGATEVVAEEFESAIEIFTLVLQHFHVPRNVIRAQTRVLRGEGYSMLRSTPLDRGVSETVLRALEAGTTDVYRIGETGRAVARTLRELDLRRRTGATVIALVRGESSYPNPTPEMELVAGDCLVLVGSHQEIDQAFQFLDGGDGAV